MIVKDIHEKLLAGIQQMLIDLKVNLPYYGEFNLFVNFHEQESVGTCGVNVSAKGMNFYYNPKFLDKLSQKEVNFITLHEDFHLLFNHPRRTVTGQYNPKLANIAQDMIINHIIWEDISHDFVEIPKDDKGKNMALFVPKEYQDKLIFEPLYEWLKDKKEEHDKKKKCDSSCKSCNGTGKQQQQQQGQGQGQGQPQNQKGQGQGQGEGQDQGDGQGQGQGNGQGDGGQHQHNNQSNGGGGGTQQPCPDCNGSGQGETDSSGKPSYGPYGKNPKNDKGSMDTHSLDSIFDSMDNNNGEYLDNHMVDEIPEELRETMVKDIMERLAARGLASGNMETTLNKLRKQRKDYLREIKRSISSVIFGTTKQRTITKPNRRGISGLKGNRKVKTKINAILDTSGSMGGTFEKVLSYIYRNDIEVNLIEADTDVKWIQTIKSKRKLETLPIKGLGGTILQPAINLVAEKFNDFNTVVLTDGYCDSLDLSKIKGRVLMISIGTKVPITKTNGKVKQIQVDPTQ